MKKGLVYLSFLLVQVMLILSSCSENKSGEPDESLPITKDNLEGTWRFVRAENCINGVISSVEETEFAIDKFPLSEMAIYHNSLSFTNNYLNGYPYSLNGNIIDWSLMTAEMRNELSIIVVDLSNTKLIIHYEYRDAGNDHINGFTDIVYHRIKIQ